MTISDKKISFVVSTYNRALLLRRAVESILNQTYSHIEVIVVDDASTDNTREIMGSFITDPRIFYFKLEQNSGPQVARNFGLKKASGDYIVIADSDDTYDPNFAKLCIECFKKNVNTSVVYCGCNVLDGNGKYVKKVMPKEHLKGYLYQYALKNLILSTTGSFMFLKKCFDGIQFDEALPCWHDDDIFIKVSKNFEFDCVQKPLLNLYFHTGARVSGNKHRYATGHYLLIEAHKENIRAVLGEEVLSMHYLNAAVDFLIAGDKNKYNELLKVSDSYFAQGALVRFKLILIKRIYYLARYLLNGFLFMKARLIS